MERPLRIDGVRIALDGPIQEVYIEGEHDKVVMSRLFGDEFALHGVTESPASSGRPWTVSW
jgi:predicted regulator of Ras-like GTPase activity (Roadblock/LC7/MglB family)